MRQKEPIRLNPVYVPFYQNPKKQRECAVDADKIMTIVQEYFGIDREMMLKKTRRQAILYPRQICIWLMDKYSLQTLPGIAIIFGYCDSTCVSHCLKAVNNYISYDEKVKQQIDFLEQKIKEQHGNTNS
jgi:chromosomal replication initiator protein